MSYDRIIEAEAGVMLFRGRVVFLLGTPSGPRYVGFPREELAKEFLRRGALPEEEFSFFAICALAASWPAANRRVPIIFFREPEELETFFRAPTDFDYSAAQVSFADIEQKG